MFERLLSRLRCFLRRSSLEADLEEELRFHVDHQIARHIRSGMSPEEAARQASLRFGGLEQAKEACRDERGARWVDVILQDTRHGLRLLRKQPGFTAAAVLILALGIGANSAIFNVVDAALLTPLPFKDPGRLTVLTEYNAVNQVAKAGAPYPDYRTWIAQSHTFEQIGAYWNVSGGDGLVFGTASSVERVRFSIVTNTFFSVLGALPAQGRTFSAADESSGGSKVFLLSDALWKRNLGGSRKAIGQTFYLDGDSFTLIGVLPPGFGFPQNCDIWLPMGVLTPRQLADRVSHPFWGIGRLKPGVSTLRAQKEMKAIAQQLSKAYPRTNANWTVRVTPLLDEFTGNVRQSLLVLSGAVFFILLVACSSVANLFLARSEKRRKEFAMRAALGASRGRLICQTLIESLVIALFSGTLALLFGSWGCRLLIALSSGGIPRLERFSVNSYMLGFTGVLTLGATVLIGISPALQLSRPLSQVSLRGSLRSQRMRSILVIAEVSVTLVLLCGASLMLGSFRKLRQVDPGFDPKRLLTMQIAIPDAQYPKVQQRRQFLDRLLARVSELPGVEAVGAVNNLPLTGERNWDSISIGDHPVTDWSHAPSAEERNVSPGYFRAMGIRLLRGRNYNDEDAHRQFRTVIVNKCMADKFWPGMNPIGRHLTTIDEPRRPWEVIGVVADIKHFGLNAENDPEMYFPYTWWSSMNLVVRSGSDSARLLPEIRREVAALDKGAPLYNVVTMDGVINRSLASERIDLYLLTSFAASALLLSAIGIHGLLAFGVNARKQEIGLRMALGASSSNIRDLVIWDGMRLVLIGLAIGAVGSFALNRVMTGLLFEVSATDPFIFSAVACLLALVAMLSCWLPARRAARLDPVIGLRFE